MIGHGSWRLRCHPWRAPQPRRHARQGGCLRGSPVESCIGIDSKGRLGINYGYVSGWRKNGSCLMFECVYHNSLPTGACLGATTCPEREGRGAWRQRERERDASLVTLFWRGCLHGPRWASAARGHPHGTGRRGDSHAVGDPAPARPRAPADGWTKG